MRGTNQILDLKVSFQENTWTNVSIELTIKTVLNDIKSDKYRKQVNALRVSLDNGNTAYYDNNKKRLPAVTFSATFDSNRSKENLKDYNNLIVLDIDKLDPKEIENCNDNLMKDEYVLSYWRSPSNKGFKGLVQLDFCNIPDNVDTDLKHKIAFRELSTYFRDTHGIELDKSGSDISRLCFVSHDENLVLKGTFSKFQITETNLDILTTKTSNSETRKLNFVGKSDALFNPLERNNQYDRKIMTDIIRHLTNKKLSITNSYEDWCEVAMAIANTFTYDVGLNYFTKLSKLDNDKFNDIHCANFLINCYETRRGNFNFASIIHLANKKGYKTKQQKLKNGVPKVEI
jgi:hypothetical protein